MRRESHKQLGEIGPMAVLLQVFAEMEAALSDLRSDEEKKKEAPLH